MPPESPRIAELRRRVDADPSSIAFAQLAEEYRRAGNYEAAEQCCRTGLTRHPGYLSARVTLGRTLIELDKLEEAEHELQFVLKSAPDNLAAIRGMAEIHQRRGHLETALDYYRRALPLARHDPEIEETVKQINRDLGTANAREKTAGLSFAEAQDEFLAALNQIPVTQPEPPAPLYDTAPDAPAHPPSLAQDPNASFGVASRTPRLADARSGQAAPGAPFAPDTSASAREEFSASYGETSPKRPEIESREGGPIAPDPVDPLIDFDNLLQSLGTPDHPAPPMVEALLTEPASPAARPEPVLPELPIETPASDPFADLERGLRAFDQPSPSRGYGEISIDAAPTYGETSPAAPEHPPSLAQDPNASFGVASRTPRLADARSGQTAPAASASAREESVASYGETSPKRPGIESREGGPSAPVAPGAGESDSTEQTILDELEAWLAAIKR